MPVRLRCALGRKEICHSL
ncbi:hypothetical protein ACMAUO_12070 [Gluconacetobacter sp. Hr-1-5]